MGTSIAAKQHFYNCNKLTPNFPYFLNRMWDCLAPPFFSGSNDMLNAKFVLSVAYSYWLFNLGIPSSSWTNGSLTKTTDVYLALVSIPMNFSGLGWEPASDIHHYYFSEREKQRTLFWLGLLQHEQDVPFPGIQKGGHNRLCFLKKHYAWYLKRIMWENICLT